MEASLKLGGKALLGTVSLTSTMRQSVEHVPQKNNTRNH